MRFHVNRLTNTATPELALQVEQEFAAREFDHPAAMMEAIEIWGREKGIDLRVRQVMGNVFVDHVGSPIVQIRSLS